MPPPSTANSMLDPWTPEPELREPPPRRSGPLEEHYPDLNEPSKMLFLGFGGGIVVVGLVLMIIGFNKKMHTELPGIVMAVAGSVLSGIYIPTKKKHEDRIEQLINFGVPVRARILHADNMTGDSAYGRSIKYQIITPGGDLVHRTANADERRLPKVIPGDATALMDMQTGDAELYCALPRRAIISTAAPHVAVPTQRQYVSPSQPGTPLAQPLRPTTPTPVTPVGPTVPAPAAAEPAPEPGRMGSLMATITPIRPTPVEEAPPVVPVAATPEVVEEAAEKTTEEAEDEAKKEPAGTTGLPWE